MVTTAQKTEVKTEDTDTEVKGKFTFEVDPKTHIPIWNTDQGVVIGFKKEHFLNDKTKEHGNEPRKQFYLYMEQFKLFRQARKLQQAEDLAKEAVDYALKAENVGKELSAEDELKAKALKAKEKFIKMKKLMSESGMSKEDIEAFLAE